MRSHFVLPHLYSTEYSTESSTVQTRELYEVAFWCFMVPNAKVHNSRMVDNILYLVLTLTGARRLQRSSSSWQVGSSSTPAVSVLATSRLQRSSSSPNMSPARDSARSWHHAALDTFHSARRRPLLVHKYYN